MKRLTTKSLVKNEYVCLLTKEQEQSILYRYRDKLPNPTEIDKLRMDLESLELRLHNVNQKLGKLEDVEEELKLDLDIFAKIIMQGYLYYKEGRKIEQDSLIMYSKYHKAFISYYVTGSGLQDSKYFFLKDYGKKWAATEQELRR